MSGIKLNTLSQIGDYFGVVESKSDFIRIIKKWALQNIVIDKEIFRSVVSEFTPTIAEDSQQPEWSQGELDKCYDELMLRNPIKLK